MNEKQSNIWLNSFIIILKVSESSSCKFNIQNKEWQSIPFYLHQQYKKLLIIEGHKVSEWKSILKEI